MQGIFVKGRRPKSKKEVKEAILTFPERVRIEATSVFGNEFDGSASELPEGVEVSFVGPDPYTKRNFYGTIVRRGEKFIVR